jgi:hypothetical protein
MDGSGCAAQVSDALALRFNLEANVLDLRRAAPNTFIAILPKEDLANRVYNEGQPCFVPPLCLHIRRWSRHATTTSGGVLSFLVEIELRGVPAHL